MPHKSLLNTDYHNLLQPVGYPTLPPNLKPGSWPNKIGIIFFVAPGPRGAVHPVSPVIGSLSGLCTLVARIAAWGQGRSKVDVMAA